MNHAFNEICDAADAAMATIGNDPNRLSELDDDGLTAVAVKVKTLRPILEAELVERTGSVDQANATLERVLVFGRSKLVKLVRRAHDAVRKKHTLTLNQLTALCIDATTGVDAITIEQQRRAAQRAGRMN